MTSLAGALSGAAAGVGIALIGHGHLLAGIPMIVLGVAGITVAQVIWWRRRRPRRHQVDWSTWPGDEQ